MTSQNGISVGEQYGRLTVEQFLPKSYCLCKCSCGKPKITKTWSLKRGDTKSCGCLWLEKQGDRSRTHGKARSRIYWIWAAMLDRCRNENNKRFDCYGGRGIYVCEEWLTAANFMVWAAQSGYRRGLQIDRKDNDGPYCPENCQWSTAIVQANNTRRNRMIEIFGEKKTARHWSADPRCFVSARLLSERVKNGWPPEKAMVCPPQPGISRHATN